MRKVRDPLLVHVPAQRDPDRHLRKATANVDVRGAINTCHPGPTSSLPDPGTAPGHTWNGQPTPGAPHACPPVTCVQASQPTAQPTCAVSHPVVPHPRTGHVKNTR